MSNFPTDFFPKPLERIIHETAGTYQFSLDYLSAAILSVTATAFGNTHSIRVKQGWIERPSLYMAIVGEPGLNKSAPLSFALRPMYDREKEMYKVYKAYIAEFMQDEKNTGKTPDPLMKSVVSDTTPEALVQQLQKNERGVMIYNDELSGFLTGFDRYNKGNNGEFYLSVWSGKPIDVIRKTSTTVMIHEPVVNILGTIQPSVLSRCFTDKIDNGFADRWLLTNPIGLQKEPWTTEDLRPEVYIEYKRIIDRLQDLQFKTNDFGDFISSEIIYSPEAWAVLLRWQAGNTKLINKTDSGTIKAIRSKMETYVHRFALIQHMCEYAAQEEGRYVEKKITIESTLKAIELTEFYTENATRFRSDDPEDALKGKDKDLFDSLPAEGITFNTNHFYTAADFNGFSEAGAKRWMKKHLGKFIVKVKHGEYSKM